MKQKLTVTVSGCEVTVLTEESEEYVSSLAALLENRLNELMLCKRLTRAEALLRISLDYLDDNVKYAQQIYDLKEELKRSEEKAK